MDRLTQRKLTPTDGRSSMSPTSFCLEVWGELACFSRPELKVERLSYPVITPSAARGLLEAIYAKPPEFRWQVTRIEVLRPPAYLTLRRNEVKDVVNAHAVSTWIEGRAQPEPLWADGDRALLGSDEKGRTQRQTVALRDVHYRISAEIRPWPEHVGRLVALEAQFRRRAERGKCFYQPYFGCREFPAYFRLGASETGPTPADWTQDLGFMLYDVFDLSRPGTSVDHPVISLFQARVEAGILPVPDYESSQVFKASRGSV